MLYQSSEELQETFNLDTEQIGNINNLILNPVFTGEKIDFRYMSIGITKTNIPILSFIVKHSYRDGFEQYIFNLHDCNMKININQNIGKFFLYIDIHRLYIKIDKIEIWKYKNLGIGTFGLKNIMELCRIIGYVNIAGYIFDSYYNDKNDPQHGQRLRHFYEKNGFIFIPYNYEGKIYKIEWKNNSVMLNKEYIADAGSMKDPNFFNNIINYCRNDKPKIEIFNELNGRRIIENTFNCIDPQDLNKFIEYLDSYNEVDI